MQMIAQLLNNRVTSYRPDSLPMNLTRTKPAEHASGQEHRRGSIEKELAIGRSNTNIVHPLPLCYSCTTDVRLLYHLSIIPNIYIYIYIYMCVCVCVFSDDNEDGCAFNDHAF